MSLVIAPCEVDVFWLMVSYTSFMLYWACSR